jgi:CHASE2 domain-containing sensor protein
MRQPATELVGTLEYMSPEQCAGEPLDERSDVYSLCVVLYQLLCGSLPHAVIGAGSTQEIVSLIQNATPRALSSHSRALAGDLNAVVMRGLSKDPAARYPSVSRLRADLERYLAGEAVEARWESLTYLARRRVRSWIGFHPRASLTASLIAAVILVLTAGFFIIFEATPLDQLSGRLQARLAPNVLLGDAPRHSLLIGIFSQPDLERVARLTQGRGIVQADGEEPAFSQRGTLSVLVDRLKSARIESLGFDIAFEAINDAAQPAATRQLASSLAGFTRTFGARPIAITPLPIKDPQLREAAAISEQIAPWCAPGMGVSGLAWGNMASQYLVQREAGAMPRPTLALAMLAMRPFAQGHDESDDSETPQELLCLRQDGPGDHLWIEAFFPGRVLPQGPLRLQYAAIESVRERTGRWGGPVAPPANPQAGLDEGEEVALLHVQLPGRSYFDAATHDVLDLLELDDASLRAVVEGKHVFVANLGPMRAVDSPLPTAQTALGADFIEPDDGRCVPGVWTHVATLESMLSGRAITRLGASGVVIISIAAAMVGAWCAIRYFRRGVRLAMLLGGLTCLMIGGSHVLFITRLEMLNPLIPALAMLLAAAFCWLGLRAQQPAARRVATA